MMRLKLQWVREKMHGRMCWERVELVSWIEVEVKDFKIRMRLRERR